MLNLESLDFYQESIDHLRKLLQITPRLIVSDLHPDYPSSRYGRELAEAVGIPQIQVQHHHAHAVAVMAEHGLQGKVLAIVLDGTGLGPDGTIWGGEILETSLTGFTRRGFLAPLPLPGGDAAAHQPWRMGLAAIHHAGDNNLLMSRLPAPLRNIAEEKRAVIVAMMQTGLNTPLTSSCGRLFDAVAALLGIRLESEFEGQAAMELEAAAARGQKTANRQKSWAEELTDRDGCCIMEHRQFFRRLIRELEAGASSDQLALEFHRWLIASLGAAIDTIAASSAGSGIRTIVLAGGCLQNRIIMEGLFQALELRGFQVFTGEEIPVNDGGVSLGQAVIGGLRYVSGNTDAGY
jgi:hydrogenase maturation protein HypF